MCCCKIVITPTATKVQDNTTWEWLRLLAGVAKVTCNPLVAEAVSDVPTVSDTPTVTKLQDNTG